MAVNGKSGFWARLCKPADPYRWEDLAAGPCRPYLETFSEQSVINTSKIWQDQAMWMVQKHDLWVPISVGEFWTHKSSFTSLCCSQKDGFVSTNLNFHVGFFKGTLPVCIFIPLLACCYSLGFAGFDGPANSSKEPFSRPAIIQSLPVGLDHDTESNNMAVVRNFRYSLMCLKKA